MRDKEVNQKDVKIPRVYPLNCESISNINKEKPSNQLRLLGFFHADMYSRIYSPHISS